MKKQVSKSSRDQHLTRREAMRIVGIAAAALGGLALPAAASSEASPFDSDSAFTDKCRDNNSIKSGQYDNTLVYPIIAFWLMLTTDEWDGCMAPSPDGKKRTEDDAKAWRTKLTQAQDLGLAPTYVERLYKDSHSASNKAAFERVKQVWQHFLTNTPLLSEEEKKQGYKDFAYGTRPCLGGKSLRQIAQLKGA